MKMMEKFEIGERVKVMHNGVTKEGIIKELDGNKVAIDTKDNYLKTDTSLIKKMDNIPISDDDSINSIKIQINTIKEIEKKLEDKKKTYLYSNEEYSYNNAINDTIILIQEEKAEKFNRLIEKTIKVLSNLYYDLISEIMTSYKNDNNLSQKRIDNLNDEYIVFSAEILGYAYLSKHKERLFQLIEIYKERMILEKDYLHENTIISTVKFLEDLKSDILWSIKQLNK
ncbi:hypothetical protein FPHOBKDP_00062 [Listeria phage LPJP1]|nr:hypothetical protein FPHOBKDP_00062 [Listeria phage LPJP1]